MNLGEIYSDFETSAPPLLPDGSGGLQMCEDLEGNLGLGFPQYFVIDSFEFSDMVAALPSFSGSPGCYYTDIDGDGVKDMVFPLGADFTGDGFSDFGYVLDLNSNGIPEADPSAPFYPIDSPDYNRIVKARTQGGIIIMSPDGTMSVYDPSGQLVREDYNAAYALWLKDNGALDKHFEHYSVTEALLFFIFLGSITGLICKIFKRRKL